MKLFVPSVFLAVVVMLQVMPSPSHGFFRRRKPTFSLLKIFKSLKALSLRLDELEMAVDAGLNATEQLDLLQRVMGLEDSVDTIEDRLDNLNDTAPSPAPPSDLVQRLEDLEMSVDDIQDRLDNLTDPVCPCPPTPDFTTPLTPSSDLEQRLEDLETAVDEFEDRLDNITSDLPPVLPDEGTLRLENTDPAVTDRGRLEIFFDGEWNTICTREFETNDATVACRQLGLPSGSANIETDEEVYGVGLGRGLYRVRPACTGSENSLMECPGDTATPFDNTCERDNDVGLECPA